MSNKILMQERLDTDKVNLKTFQIGSKISNKKQNIKREGFNDKRNYDKIYMSFNSKKQLEDKIVISGNR